MIKNKLLDNNRILEILGDEYKNLTNVISDRVGIINALMERHELDEFGLKMFQCISASTPIIFNLDREVTSGGLGVNEDEKSALIGCIAEAIERYCMTYTEKKELIKKRWIDIPLSQRLNNYHLYSNKQYKENLQFANPLEEEIEWVKLKPAFYKESSECSKEQELYWPASLIYLPFMNSKPVAETSSTGMAASFNKESAISSGIFELIERDSLMLNFQLRLNPDEIDIESINGLNKEMINKIKKQYNIKLYKLYSDIKVPIYLCVIWTGKGKKTHYGIGASANFDSDIAIKKAIRECLFSHFYSKNILDLKKNNPDEIKTLYEHFLYYQGENFEKLLFNSKVIKYKRENITKEQLIKTLNENKLEVYYKELTTVDVQETGFTVLKVVIPSLIDLNKTHVLQRMGASRFFEVPKKLRLNVAKELNTLPHPFP